MPLYRYVKATPATARPSGAVRANKHYLWSFFLMSIGGGLLVWVGWPILSFVLTESVLLAKTISPIQDARLLAVAPVSSGAVLGNSQVAADFTNPNVWFPQAPQKKVVTPVNTYTLTIPKLRIQKARVVIASDDLTTNLIHYGGTGLPGDYGNAVIFGHSTLPQLYDPQNYKTIFSLLPTLKEGDDFFINYDGVTYRYRVYNMAVTEPTDLTPLEQYFDDSYVTLVTCVPPGTYWRRLNVRARLVRLGE